MEPMILDSNRQPDRLVESYDSLIWTERFNTDSDFQLTSGYVEHFMNLLPRGTLLTLRESNRVFEVENHKVERKKRTAAKLIITGRGHETILDRRVALKSLIDSTEWLVNLKTPSDLAYYLINYICVLGSLDPLDVFPSSVVFPAPADYLASTGPVKALSVPKGNLYAAVQQLLQTEARADSTTTPATPAVVPHGIRAVRPNAAGTAVAIEIYTGVDRFNTVYFDAKRDLLDDGNYLFSKVGSATTAYIQGPSVSAKMNKQVTPASGFDRRVILVDGTSSGIDDIVPLRAQGDMSLGEAKETAMFDGAINQDLSEYVYGRDYNLGDIVRLEGDYGLSQRVRVTEYIRSDDATGPKAYPTLTAID